MLKISLPVTTTATSASTPRDHVEGVSNARAIGIVQCTNTHRRGDRHQALMKRRGHDDVSLSHGMRGMLGLRCGCVIADTAIGRLAVGVSHRIAQFQGFPVAVVDRLRLLPHS